MFTHDSIGLGEDGPAHQPVEHLASLRCIPGLLVLRPADAAETAEAWRRALRYRTEPSAIVLTRQKLPLIDRTTHGAVVGSETFGASAPFQKLYEEYGITAQAVVKAVRR